MAMLTVENINVYYGAIHALKGISIEVKEGQIVTLIGSPCPRSDHNFLSNSFSLCAISVFAALRMRTVER